MLASLRRIESGFIAILENGGNGNAAAYVRSCFSIDLGSLIES